mgnify:CR=1 FL=1
MSPWGREVKEGFQHSLPERICLGVILIFILVFGFGPGQPAWSDELAERLKNEDLEQLIHLRQGSSKSFRTPFPLSGFL